MASVQPATESRKFHVPSVRRWKVLWFTVTLSTVIVELAVGLGLAVEGAHAISGVIAPYRLLLTLFPRSIEVHGCILLAIGMLTMCTIGALLVAFSRSVWKFARIPILTALVYSFWSFWCFASAAWLNHHYNPQMWWYLSLAVISGALAAGPPPFDGERIKVVSSRDS